MGIDVLAYPFLFLAIFFESFILVTLLSKPARAARKVLPARATPTVAIIVPCWNEESTILATCKSLLSLVYSAKKLSIILVDDGSTDATPKVMAQYKNHPQVKIIRKENGGKHTALNAGLAQTNAEFVGCLDADSFVAPDALSQIIPFFAKVKVGAVTAAMSVHEPKKVIQHMQYAEYAFGITMRHTLASINGLYVTPGPFSFYRASALRKVGNFRHGHQTEDMEMALRLQQAGYIIENAPHARVYTKSPDTILKLIKQRTRWTSGFLRNILGEYRGLLFSKKNNTLGNLILPIALVAIISTVVLFSVTIFMGITHIITAIEVRADIPLSYTFNPHLAFDWFYFPSNAYVFLGVLTVMTCLSLMLIGKKISRIQGGMGLGMLSYLLLYGFVAPVWLIRSAFDFTFKKHRGWRG